MHKCQNVRSFSKLPSITLDFKFDPFKHEFRKSVKSVGGILVKCLPHRRLECISVGLLVLSIHIMNTFSNIRKVELKISVEMESSMWTALLQLSSIQKMKMVAVSGCSHTSYCIISKCILEFIIINYCENLSWKFRLDFCSRNPISMEKRLVNLFYNQLLLI